jgi:hypothetical protein
MKILFTTMKLSAAELEKASNVAFIVSDPRIPFFLMVSMAGLI